MTGNDEVARIKERADVVAIVGERVQLKKAGRNFRGLCPFHGEKTPSFFVTPEMQMYKCFGCGAGGDVLSFLMAYEGWDFREALEYLAKKVGVKLQSFKGLGGDRTRERQMEIMHLAAEYYHYLLTEHRVGQLAREYLKKRGVFGQSIKDFGIGYAAKTWDGLMKYLVGKKNYRSEELEAVGLIIGGQRTVGSGQKHYYDRFRGRVMFPLKDFAGHIVGFSGRVLEQEAKDVKYINSPETALYHKSECLFGLSQAKKAIREAERVVVVEGEMDVIISHQAGVKETVAVKGSALTEKQVLNLRKLTQTMVLAMDADEAGQAAMERGVQVAEKQGMNLRVLVIEGGKDPAEVGQQDPKRWREMTKKTVPVYQYLMDGAFVKYGGSEGTEKKKISQAVVPILAKIENAVERDYYLKRLAEKLGVRVAVVEEEVAKVGRGVAVGEREEEVGVKTVGRRERLERYLIAVLLQGERMEAAWGQVEVEWFENSYLARLVKEMKRGWVEESDTTKRILGSLPGELQALAKELHAAEPELWTKSVADLEVLGQKTIEELRGLALRSKLNRLTGELTEISGVGEERERKLAEYRTLMRRLKIQG